MKDNTVMLRKTLFDILVQLSGAGALGIKCPLLCKQDNEILHLATEQHVLPLLACAALRSPGQLFHDDVENYLLELMRTQAAKNLLRNQRVLHLIKEMENAGFSIIVLKGCSVSYLYAYPESRDSVDVDLLIKPEQEHEVYRFLRQYGFSISGRTMTANDSVCEHKKYGRIEIHVSLYPEITKTAWKRIDEESFLPRECTVRIDTPNGSFETLGHTEQLIFLSLHMAKHFVESGMTIRMMLDIALHYARYKNEIDTGRYWHLLKKLHLDSYIACVLWILVQNKVFAEADFPGLVRVDDSQIDAVISDVLQGGYMGAKEAQERHEAGMEYHRQLMLKTQSRVRYKIYMLGWKIRSGISNMFPSYTKLKKLYPIVVCVPAMASLMWVYHVILFPYKKIKSGVLRKDIRSEMDTMHEVSRQRMKLFKRLSML